jgi:ubiquinone/menaquinone biosynthesis C-methylase UbiE
MHRIADLPSFSSSIDFIKKSLQLSSKPAVVFDQCCGTGLYSLVLGKKLAPSSKVIGVDISAVQIEHAKNEAAKQQLTGICDFMIGDACTYTPTLLCDGAFNINSSFGYSDSDKTNIKMLNRVYETLKPGGRFILEYRNMSYLNANFVFSQSEQYKTPDGTITTVTWHAHKDSRKLYKNYVFETEGKEPITLKGGGIRLYTPEDLQKMLFRAGFKQYSFFGGLTGELFSKQNSPRCVIVCSKP